MINTKGSVVIFGVIVLVLISLIYITVASRDRVGREGRGEPAPTVPSDPADSGSLVDDGNDNNDENEVPEPTDPVDPAEPVDPSDPTDPGNPPNDPPNDDTNDDSPLRISYGKESRQWLMLYRPSVKAPAKGYPVYLWAHGNGGAADRPSSRMVKEMNDAGYAVISWESIPTIRTSPEQFQIAQSDMDLMWAWFKKNATSYKVNPNNVIIGGDSRGSGLSWEIAHSGDPAIKGIYMYNAVPDSFWLFTDQWNPDDFVTPNSPPIEFAYGPTRGDGDSHRPENGDSIRAEYEADGIGDRFLGQVEGLGDGYQYPGLLKFARTYFD